MKKKPELTNLLSTSIEMSSEDDSGICKAALKDNLVG